MKRTASILLALIMTLGFAACGHDDPVSPTPTDAVLTEAVLTEAVPTEVAPTEGTPAPTEMPEVVMSPEYAVMRLKDMVYGTDYSSLYDAFGESVTIADVRENGNGLAYITRDGKDYELGLDFLSMAMIYNTDPAGEFTTAEEVFAEWWRYYELRWNRLLPEIPLYRNEYYSLYSTKITGVAENPINPYFPQERAVLYWGSEKEDNSIIIGNRSEMAGYFRLPEMARSSADGSVDALVNGLELVSKTREGGLCWNDTVVKSHEEIPVEGGVDYRIELWDDLYFSDGSPVTAVDYIAKLMAALTPVFKEAFPDANLERPAFIGEDDPFLSYDGTEGTGTLSCVRLNGERSFTISLPSSIADSFYALEQFEITAQPHELWLCGAQIKDDGEGCYITSDYYIRKKGGFTQAEKLRNIRADLESDSEKAGPWSGPYRIVYAGPCEYEYTIGGAKVTLEKNEYFKGNYEGVKPSIERIDYVMEFPEMWVEEITKGKIDLITGIVGGAAIDNAIKAAEDSDGAFDTMHYSRAGYGAAVMRDDFGPVQFASVRRALAYCIDRKEFTDVFNGGSYTSPVDAPIHEDMWQYKAAQKRGLELEHYDLDFKKAIEELVADGWVYDENGEPYVSGVRYKRIPGDLINELDTRYGSVDGQYITVKVGDDYYMPLVLNWFTTPDTPADLLFTLFEPDETGIRFCSTFGMFPQMLDEFYQRCAYGYYGGMPCYTSFLFGRGYSDHFYDRSGRHTIDPMEYEDSSENYLKDWADVYFMNDD